MSYKKNVATSVHFVPVNVNDGSVITSGSATANIAVFSGGSTATTVATTNNPTHKGSGIWELQLTATEMNHDLITVRPVITDMVPQFISINTEEKLVSELNDFDVGASLVNVGFINGITVTGPEDLMANTSALSTFDPAVTPVSTGTNVVRSDIRQVLGSAISSINDFKADAAGITAAFAGTTVLANIVEVTGTAVTDVTDFHVNTSGLSIFDYTNPNHKVSLKDNAITSNVLDSTALSAITNNIMNYNVDGNGTSIPYVDFSTLQEMVLAFIAGRVQVTDNGSTRTFTFYRRGSSGISFTITASEQENFEGQRSNEGTIGS